MQKKNIDIEALLQKMTLEEKASLCSGSDFWHTEAIKRLGIESIMVSDGPHGLRKQEELTDHMGVAESIKAVCFPTASAMACSFDRDLLNRVGDALGEECEAEGIAVLLGPGVNMKRSPLCGRNFEYYSEDPYLAGELGSAYISGVQKHHVGTSLKHFAANNQEYRRMSTSAEIDERTLRETYLSAFERIIKKSQPWTVMCSYNRINGTYSCENDWLLNQVLRDEWGFKGLVMTDWGAMNERVKAIQAGLDLEMPSSHGETDRLLVAAVQDGTLSEDVLDQAVRRVLTFVEQYFSHQPEHKKTYDKAAHHQLAKIVASESAVLLKNDGILPLERETKVALIGEFAKVPRIQGGGSSHINCFRTESAWDVLSENEAVTYAQGYRTDQDEIDEDLEAEAIEAAKSAEVAVIFAGLPDAFESEGFDRKHMDMPDCQNQLIDRICEVQPNTVVILHNGSPVRMPWIGKVRAVLEMYLAGQASGAAATDLIYGDANPSGKLAETFPLRIEDNPSYLNFPGTRTQVSYHEGVFIGYRYYDKKKLNVLFPFGHGLSYTTFQYTNAKLAVNGRSVSGTSVGSVGSSTSSDYSMDVGNIVTSITAKDTDEIQVTVDITNTGTLAGKETVQLYVKNAACEANRPDIELKEFAKVSLEPHETKTVTFELDQRSFAYYSTELHDWFAPSGDYELQLAASSRDIRQTLLLHLESTSKLPFHVDATTTCGDVFASASDPSVLQAMLDKSGFAEAANKTEDDSMGAGTAEMMQAMFADTPLHSILSFSGKELTWEDIQETIRSINEKNV